MKILYLTFYFKPDLCAGSFRNTPIVNELSNSLGPGDSIHVVTTFPNRYNSYKKHCIQYERINENLNIKRIKVPTHKGGFLGQIITFTSYFFGVLQYTKNKEFDLVFASSSRLFTAFLGAIIARRKRIALVLDIRDIFVESIRDVIKNRFVLFFLIPILTIIEHYSFGYAKKINLVSEGFRSYFEKYKQATFTFFTNGIDDEFLDLKQSELLLKDNFKIVYAGNLGEGQGLHTIVPAAAKALGNNYNFLIVGDGAAKKKLQEQIDLFGVQNVKIIPPINRKELIKFYEDADFLFVHLNNYLAFEKVLPSKIFEYGAFDKPIIAGVSGYSAEFIRNNIENHILFLPGDVNHMVRQILNYEYKLKLRRGFIEKFSRKNIVKDIVGIITNNVK
jgi:glycosyltransferase involved in cell wall biosynthesis